MGINGARINDAGELIKFQQHAECLLALFPPKEISKTDIAPRSIIFLRFLNKLPWNFVKALNSCRMYRGSGSIFAKIRFCIYNVAFPSIYSGSELRTFIPGVLLPLAPKSR